MFIEAVLFSNRPSSYSAMHALMTASSTAKLAGIQVQIRPIFGSLIHVARNRAVATMNPDASHLLMVDDDMLPEPQAIVKLANLGADIATPLCTTRVPPVELCVKVWNPVAKSFCMMDDIRRDRPVTGKFAAGAGFLMMRRELVEELIEYYLSGRDWVNANLDRHARMEVSLRRVERERARIEGIRRELFASEKLVRVFDYPVLDNEIQLGEDIGLGLPLMELGKQVTVDPTIQVGHLGEYPFSPADYEPKGQAAAA